MNIKETITAVLNKIKNVLILIKIKLKAMFTAPLTPQRLQRIDNISNLIIMAVTFIVGYLVLNAVNHNVCMYLLSANLLMLSNYLLIKLM